MIKINLLPRHMLEGRRVKALARLLVVVLVLELAALAAYVWAPAPFSVSSQMRRAQDRRQDAVAKANAVRDVEAQVQQVRARFAEVGSWVRWKEESDKLPQEWVDYFTAVNRCIPADVVVLNGLAAPSGNVLTMSGATSGLKAAARWYLNMLRAEIVDPTPGAVTFSTATVGYPGELPTGPNPKMQQSVTMRVVLRPEYLSMLNLPAAPASAGVAGAGGRTGGGRMGMAGGGRMADRGGMMGGGMRRR
jgi:hypothetical protein